MTPKRRDFVGKILFLLRAASAFAMIGSERLLRHLKKKGKDLLADLTLRALFELTRKTRGDLKKF